MAPVRYSIVIPCYASGAWLEELAGRIARVMAAYEPFELILVNDKSPDAQAWARTWAVIEHLAAEFDFVRGLDLLYNVGQFRATLCGLAHARGRFVITMDDDGQHPPEELPKLIQAMAENPALDCIMGEYAAKRHGPLRNLGSRLLRGIMNRLYGKPAGVVTTSFRIMPASFARTLVLCRIAHPQLGPLIASLSRNLANVKVAHDARRRGSSGYSLARCVREAYHSVINSSVLPLRVFSLLGFATAGVAFFVGFFFLARWLLVGVKVKGFMSLILAVSFFSGMLLAGIGVLGEYIGRVIQELTGMPRYEISRKAGGGHDADG